MPSFPSDFNCIKLPFMLGHASKLFFVTDAALNFYFNTVLVTASFIYVLLSSDARFTLQLFKNCFFWLFQ